MSKALLVISKYLPEYTGAAYRLNSLYKRLGDRNVEVLCNSTSETRSLSYVYEGVSVRRVVFPFRISARSGRVVHAIKVYYEALFSFFHMMRVKPDFLHIAGYSGATMAALLYGRIYNVPRLIELVTKDAVPYQYLPGFRYSNFLRLDKGAVVVAISDAIAQKCKAQGLSDNVWCRPNPIDETRFKPCDAAGKQVLRKAISPFGEDDIVIGMVAKFMPQKNQIFLIDVLKDLPEEYKLLLAGPRVDSGIYKDRDERYFQEILKRIKEYDLSDRVHIQEGFVDAADYMKASDVYVMPQYSEGLGTPMLEAIACAVPVVANIDEPAFAEWVRDGENGYLAQLEADEWCRALKKACDITAGMMSGASEDILSIAAINKCDAQYRFLFKALSKQEQVRVSDVL